MTLTDERLKAILLVGCNYSKANIDGILVAKRQFHKSYFVALFVRFGYVRAGCDITVLLLMLPSLITFW